MNFGVIALMPRRVRGYSLIDLARPSGGGLPYLLIGVGEKHAKRRSDCLIAHLAEVPAEDHPYVWNRIIGERQQHGGGPGLASNDEPSRQDTELA